jgi:hypothetical protein
LAPFSCALSTSAIDEGHWKSNERAMLLNCRPEYLRGNETEGGKIESKHERAKWWFGLPFRLT